MTPALSLTLATGQIVAVTLSDPAQVRLLADLAVGLGQAQAFAEVANRTYHMGTKPTDGLAYDDRLTARLKCCATTAYAYLELPVARGGLRHARLGKKYLVTERAVREFLGDPVPEA